MKTLKTVLILLLAWTFSVQAIAGASGAICRQAGERTAAEAPQLEHTAMAMANDAHAMHGAGHADHRKAAEGSSTQQQKAASEPMPGCDCGCQCVDQLCGSSASGLAAGPAEGMARFFADTLRPARGAASPASAHARDLIRPPSIT
ncbi:MAG: hypothetical protein ACPHN2_00510 [Sinimarinibacterium flocculans]|uniref:CopL family metal-binding regulatory protein n=1 Tax=Sinimarinibacterium flocculans TaxID=985250 RepID=A0A318E9R8_9GAMM|nr:hypothetical protein [Sinimarinibacterium flocculans]PXV63702.1 hypothetical protein C8D93_11511 [Sinimarinibacterium flocculans]